MQCYNQLVSDEITCPTCQTKNPLDRNYCKACGALLKPSLVGEGHTCPFCQQPVTETDFFCPSCGRKIQEKPLSTSILTQTWIYFLSFFLPPLGLWPGFKYLKQIGSKYNPTGCIAIILTFASRLITALLVVNVMNQVNEQMNKQLQNMTF